MPTWDIPADARFSCQQCAGCCYRWHVYLTPEEQARLMPQDWAAHSPRLAGVKLFEEFPAPSGKGARAVRLARVDGACVFLEPDSLCLIHKLQGIEAKPGPCQQYPYHFAGTPRGVNVSVDFACSAVLADEGPLLTEALNDVEGAYRAGGTRAEVLAQLGLPAKGALGEVVALAPGQPLHWDNYLLLEGALLDLLGQADAPLGQRLLGMNWLLDEANRRFTRTLGTPSAALGDWTRAQAAEGYATALAAPPPAKLSPMRQRAVLAPFLGGLEQQWATWGRAGVGVSTRLTLAVIVVNGVGPLPLSSLEATLDQGKLRATRFPQDDPAISGLLGRYLRASIQRKSLLEGTDLLVGWRYLLLSFAAARWYAVARATLAGRAVCELDDLRQGLKVVEKGLGHAVGLREPATQRVMRFLFRLVGSPGLMIHNFHSGEATPARAAAG